MSARPFWVVFTFCVVVLIEWLVVPVVINHVFTQEITSMTMTMREVTAVLDKQGIDVPSEVTQRSGDDIIKPEEIDKYNLRGKLPANITIREAKDIVEKKSLEVPEELFQRSPDDTLKTEDLKYFGFWRGKFQLMGARDSTRPYSYILGLFAAGILAGFLFASIAFRNLISFGDKLNGMTGTDWIAVLIGFLAGLLLSWLLLPIISALPFLAGVQENPSYAFLFPLLRLVIIYACIVGMMSMKEELKHYFPNLALQSGELERDFQRPKILDTNVIIDGRIADICRAGFIEGQVIIPTCVVEELQHIADSADSLRRARGRRGLDILNAMKKEFKLTIRQSEAVDPDNQDEVDMRLVKLAKEIEGSIVTNDFNLNKVAELHGVQVLNINELANALKPVALPGEEMTVNIVKEGKEVNQGIAYLDDGTMVVVENGKKHIGETADVVVASVLQTVAGKMIFTNIKDIQREEDDLIGRNVRSYSGVRPRNKTR